MNRIAGWVGSFFLATSLLADSPTPTVMPNQRRSESETHATGSFQVKVTPGKLPGSLAPAIVRMTLDKEFHGDLEATSKGEMNRAALTGQGVFPRPLQDPLPISLGVSGTPSSFVRGGNLGLPLTVAIIGGESRRFQSAVELYRQAWQRAGHPPGQLKVGIHSLGYVADTIAKAGDDFFPGYARSFTEIGKERGWPPFTRGHFEALRGPTGALLVGDPEMVAEKILYVNEALGGISRMSFQMSVAALPHAQPSPQSRFLDQSPLARSEEIARDWINCEEFVIWRVSCVQSATTILPAFIVSAIRAKSAGSIKRRPRRNACPQCVRSRVKESWSSSGLIGASFARA